jgi:phage terminase large subunit
METLQADKATEAMIIAFKDAGMPRDQADRFATAGYIPLKGYLPFHVAAREADRSDGPQLIALGGKRGPGKSHAIMAQIGLDDCMRSPGLKVLFLRKIKASAKESMQDVIGRVFTYTKHEMTGNGLKLPNGSRITIGGFRDENDVEKFLGIEFDSIVIEEATQLAEDKVQKLRGSLRTSKSSWRPRMYLSTNADGIGLLWFKKTFINPYRAGTQGITRFFDVTKIQNPFINSDYEQWLDSLTGPLRKAWRDGDWDAFAGMAFPMWNESRHVVEPFEIPNEWLRWRAVDDGTAAPWCCLWFTRDPDTRRIYIYREAYQAELTNDQQCERILDMSQPKERFEFTYADPAMWQRKNYRGRVYSSAEQYKDKGVPLTRADNDRIGGKRKVDQLLSYAPDGYPAMQIFSHCEHVIEQLSTLARDKLNPEDVDTKQEDHAYDTVRYGATNVKKVENKPREQFKHPLAGVKGL